MQMLHIAVHKGTAPVPLVEELSRENSYHARSRLVGFAHRLNALDANSLLNILLANIPE
jgi:hypothetical protein